MLETWWKKRSFLTLKTAYGGSFLVRFSEKMGLAYYEALPWSEVPKNWSYLSEPSDFFGVLKQIDVPTFVDTNSMWRSLCIVPTYDNSPPRCSPVLLQKFSTRSSAQSMSCDIACDRKVTSHLMMRRRCSWLRVNKISLRKTVMAILQIPSSRRGDHISQ